MKGDAHGWRPSYSHEGKRKLLSLGTYPGVSLAMARRRAVEARALVFEGVDPSDARKQAKTRVEQQREQERLIAESKPLPETFEALAREWYAVRSAEWSPGYSEKVIARLEGDVFPFIGRRPVGELVAPELLEVLRRVEARGVVETAHRVLESCSQIFRYAVGKGSAKSDPARDLKGLLKKPLPKHFPAITKPDRLA